MDSIFKSLLQVDLATAAQRGQLLHHARQRRWGLALLLIGWLHLLAFLLCYYLTVQGYHEAGGYLSIWLSEIVLMSIIFRLCGGPVLRGPPAPPLARFIVRVWLAYFLLAFNLGTMNTLRGHRLFELFPAMASLASFAFLVLTFTVHRRFFWAVLVLFGSGLLMAAHLLQAYLIFALAWWLVLNGIGMTLWWERQEARGEQRVEPRRDVAATFQSEVSSTPQTNSKC